MNLKIDAAQNKFIDRIGQMSNTFGLNDFVAKLYALLYLSASPMSLDDMADALGVSKGNVSINIRILEKWGAARKVWIKGSRKDFYEANTDIKKVFLGKISAAIQKRISEISSIVEEFDGIISSADKDFTEEEKKIMEGHKERLKKIKELKDLVSNALVIADKLF